MPVRLHTRQCNDNQVLLRPYMHAKQVPSRIEPYTVATVVTSPGMCILEMRKNSQRKLNERTWTREDHWGLEHGGVEPFVRYLSSLTPDRWLGRCTNQLLLYRSYSVRVFVRVYDNPDGDNASQICRAAEWFFRGRASFWVNWVEPQRVDWSSL